MILKLFRNTLAKWLFAIIAGLNACLLFLVQPLLGKALLPLFGGSSSVWLVCMLFFQAALLLGYVLVVLVDRIYGTRRYSFRHVLLGGCAAWLAPSSCAGLPGVVATLQAMCRESNLHPNIVPIMSLLAILGVVIGIPFVFLAMGGPLTQRWYAHTSDKSDKKKAYQLFAFSNAGSLAALLLHPFVLEPNLSLNRQWQLWNGLFVLNLLGWAGCAWMLVKTTTKNACSAEPDQPGTTDSPGIADRPGMAAQPGTTDSPGTTGVSKNSALTVAFGKWLVWSFIPTSLFLSVTTRWTTDLSPVPMLWIIPLGIFLLTYIIVFSGHWQVGNGNGGARMCFSGIGTMRKHGANIAWGVTCVALLAWRWGLQMPHWWFWLLDSVLLAAVGLLCHDRLYASRPAPEHLLEFNLAIGCGGFLGGVVNALFAPLLFSTLLEGPLTLFLLSGFALLLLEPPGRSGLVFGIASLALLHVFDHGEMLNEVRVDLPVVGIFLGAALLFLPLRRARWVLPMVIFCGTLLYPSRQAHVLHRARGFFGPLTVEAIDAGAVHVLRHGNTHHGGQVVATSAEKLSLPLFYYVWDGPVGEIFRATWRAHRARRVGVIGLGAGSLAWYARPWQEFVFFEIDPEVIRIAKNPAWFTYLEHCRAPWQIVEGDARLELAHQPDSGFDLLIIDAYFSNAIPVHLLTREAFALYAQKLSAQGVLLLHISNRYLDLAPIVAASLKAIHWEGRLRVFRHPAPTMKYDQDAKLVFKSRWIVAAADKEDLDNLVNQDWLPLQTSRFPPLWTDQTSSLWQVFFW